MAKEYLVAKTEESFSPSGKWDGQNWASVPALDIDTVFGPQPKFMPKAQVKFQYDQQFVYVIFRVEDEFIRAVAAKHHQPVYTDSCVEFFFTPGEDISQGYINIETNCGGTVVSRHQTGPGVNRNPLTDSEIAGLNIYHSEPKIVEPEKTEPTTWLIEYRVEVKVLERLCPVARPGPDVIWRANFYKCGQETSNPHLLTWSPIESEEITFHQPQFFGTLRFE